MELSIVRVRSHGLLVLESDVLSLEQTSPSGGWASGLLAELLVMTQCLARSLLHSRS